MRSRTVSSDTSSQIARSSAVRNFVNIDIKLSACGNVRGNPSKTNPWPPCKRNQSSISSMMILSETSPPLRSTSAVSCPSGVPRSRSRRKIAPGVSSAIKGAPADSALAKKSVVMPLNQVCLHLPHRIEHDAYNDQQACAAEELSRDHRHIQRLTEQTWEHRDQR